jgi:glycerophosphoryl diester phosphodiesterase
MSSRTRAFGAAALAALCLSLLPLPAANAGESTTSIARTDLASRAQAGEGFDLQAHRGGLGLTVESTLPAFARALRLGVTTLELDTQITEDGQAVVTHDRRISGAKCLDTAPPTPGDPEWPYVGSYIRNLTYAQVSTLDCGTQRLGNFPRQVAAPGAPMPLLSEVFDLVEKYDADDVTLNIETKVEAGAPAETAPRAQFVRVVAGEVREAGLLDQVTIQSFDWGALMLMAETEPDLPLVALDNEDFLQVGQPGASPWLGGIDIDDFGGDPIAAIDSFGAAAWSPVQGRPQGGSVNDPTFVPYVTRDKVDRAHERGIAVVPWTVDDRATMAWLMDRGVDGIITDYPDVLRDLMAERRLPLPTAYQDPQRGPVVVPNAHAHNDYEHERPLVDALERGFLSVEADVWLRDGELLIAHDEVDLDPTRTLRGLYLDPLARRVHRNGGDVYRGDDRTLQLLVDIKTEGVSTYAAIDRELRDYERMLTRFAPRYRPGAVEVVISGNRPLAAMQAQTTRWAGYDGRLGDLDAARDPELMPLVSDNWANHFTWRGTGPFPAAEQAKLLGILERAHANGYRLRFWNTPDAPGAARSVLWSVLYDSGVDHLNTDDLGGLSEFLRNRAKVA